MKKFTLITSLLFLILNTSFINAQTKTLVSSTNQTTTAVSSGINNNIWTDVTSTLLTLTAGTKVLVEATIEVDVAGDKKDIEAQFRLTDGTSESEIISRLVEQKSYNDKGLVAISFIFNYASTTGSKTFTLQQSKNQTGNQKDAFSSKAIITAIEIESTAVALPNGQGSLTSLSASDITFSQVTATNAIVLEKQATIYIVSTFSTSTSSNAEATGEWVLRESTNGGTTYTTIDDTQITRTILDATSIGAATIVTLINRPAGTYNFELAYKVNSGSNIITSGATISAIALKGTEATGGDVFASVAALFNSDDNSTSTYKPIFAETITPPSNASNQLFLRTSFNMTATGGDIAYATYQFDSNASFTNFEIQRYVPDGKIGSGGLIGIVSGLNTGSSYDISFEHKISPNPGNTLTTFNVNAIGFYLTSSPKFTWEGNTDSNWNTASNWDLNVVPGASDIITIPSGMSNNPIISTSGNRCYNLTVESGASLTVNAGQDLTITGNLNQVGLLTLESTSTTYASLIANGTATGAVNYKRHVNIATANDLISAPVTGQTFGDFSTDNPTLFPNPANNTEKLFGAFDNDTNLYFTYDTAIPAEAAIILTPGIGYRAGSTDNGTFTFTGTVNNETVTTPIKIGAFPSRWNLIGNPYPSYLKVEDFINTNTAVMDPTTVALYGFNNETDSGASGIWTIYNLNTIGTNPLITPGQGFYVAATSTTPADITFSPSMRSIGSSDDFIQGKSASENLNLKLQITNSTKSFSTDFYFNNNSSVGLDPGYDAAVFGSSAPEFSIYSHLIEENTGRDMAIQSLSTKSSTNAVVPLGINTKAGEELTVRITNSNLPENIFIYLEDNVTNKMTLLNEDDYTFIANENLTSTGRFHLSFKTSKVLTVEDELQTETGLQLYTTPNNILFVNGKLNETTSIYLFDMQGRKVTTRQIQANNISTQIDLSQFNSGIYIIQVINNLVNKTKKVIIR
ncbi:Por secretion system C-terminal sorting domain-containing protein [Lutibacter agarilyticus]|uniref:Por secretion system C-terminal sorting domain-containing protein n=1 Tax=Lutibacter agarilyticus TaxID=1109740 RepID=A0A238V968_9FLAO|nr:T9SS type A sorting domain-containing protein [Lutibacter agarilyticus]SNR30173.1 Por secretion system C-terminal sorting domain-containing protein [Lutibacter agarilyticus]